jgi:hypothetical protein
MIQENKTHVVMKSDSKEKNMDVWIEGERGYIDGYVGGGSIAVVIGDRIIICDTWDVKVYIPQPRQSIGPR